MEIAVLVFLSSGLFLGWSLGANDAANAADRVVLSGGTCPLPSISRTFFPESTTRSAASCRQVLKLAIPPHRKQ